jgi:hypothetical protein
MTDSDPSWADGDDEDAMVAFLLARLDEEEAAAKAVRQPREWHQGDESDPWARWDRDMIYMWPPEFHTPVESDRHWRGLQADDDSLAAHIARHDPSRVLASIAADRRMIEEYRHYPDSVVRTCVEARAAVHSDHPDYRQEWKP